MKRDYSKIDFTCENCSIKTFVEDFNLQKEANECFGKNWSQKETDSEMVNSLLEHLDQDIFIAVTDDEFIVDVFLDEDKKELRDTKKLLRLALLQLQEYSENDLIIADGKTISISEQLKNVS